MGWMGGAEISHVADSDSNVGPKHDVEAGRDQICANTVTKGEVVSLDDAVGGRGVRGGSVVLDTVVLEKFLEEHRGREFGCVVGADTLDAVLLEKHDDLGRGLASGFEKVDGGVARVVINVHENVAIAWWLVIRGPMMSTCTS
jgi:hypothetical protein